MKAVASRENKVERSHGFKLEVLGRSSTALTSKHAAILGLNTHLRYLQGTRLWKTTYQSQTDHGYLNVTR